MEIIPLHDKIVVELSDVEKKTSGGIILPTVATSKPNTGTVIEAGPGIYGPDGKLQPTTVKKGDIVIFSRGIGTEIKVAGKSLVVINESDIFAKVV